MTAELVEEYERQILAALVPGPGKPEEQCIDNLHFLISSLQIDRLTPKHRSLINAMISFREETGTGFMTEADLVDMLRTSGAPPEKQVEYQDLYHYGHNLTVSVARFKFLISQLVTLWEENEYTLALNDAFTVLKTGITKGKEQRKGYQDSRIHLIERLNTIDVEFGTMSFPEGDPRVEAPDSYRDAQNAAADPNAQRGLMSSWSTLDAITNGFRKGRAVMAGGFAGIGKTMIVVNWGYSFLMQGANVVYGTAEVPYHELKQRFYVRHARNPNWGLPQGIDGKLLEAGKLSPEELAGYSKAMEDFKTNSSYGQIRGFQVPEGGGIEYCKAKLLQYQKQFPVDVFIYDSLNQGAKITEDQRINLNQQVRSFSKLATNFDNGKGLIAISPWHANRKSYDQAKKDGYYTMASWSESDEVEKAFDMMIWFLDTDNSLVNREYLWGICKNRQGKVLQSATYYADWASCYVGEVAVSPTASSAGGATAPQSQFEQRVAGLF